MDKIIHKIALVIATIFHGISSLFGLRHRYVFTRDNRVRFRYILPMALVILVVPFVLAYYFGGDSKPVAMTENGTAYEMRDYISVQGPIRSLVLPAVKPPYVPTIKEKTIALGKGDTVAGLLQEKGVSGDQAYDAVKALSKHIDPRRVKSGQKFFMRLEPAAGGAYDLANLTMEIDAIKTVDIALQDDVYRSKVIEKNVTKFERAGKVTIENSFFGSTLKAGIPTNIAGEMMRIYSFDIDFQRDIRRDDKLEVLYETYETDEGEVIKTGKVLYAKLTNRGKDIPMYRFKMRSGKIDYFDPKGRSVRKQLMKTPIDGARMSSGYGMRRHPVLGYGKMHKGVDFAARTGTPIYAAGDGVIERANWFSSYGKYIRIRHNGTLKTAYAHLNGFAKGIKAGKRVEQGQVIGYVGTTGRSTGPHLHYEVMLNGKQVNPNRVDLPTGEQLTGKEFESFKAQKRAMDQMYAAKRKDLKVASTTQ